MAVSGQQMKSCVVYDVWCCSCKSLIHLDLMGKLAGSWGSTSDHWKIVQPLQPAEKMHNSVAV